jgi:hypothetical protein
MYLAYAWPTSVDHFHTEEKIAPGHEGLMRVRNSRHLLRLNLDFAYLL